MQWHWHMHHIKEDSNPKVMHSTTQAQQRKRYLKHRLSKHPPLCCNRQVLPQATQSNQHNEITFARVSTWPRRRHRHHLDHRPAVSRSCKHKAAAAAAQHQNNVSKNVHQQT